MNRTDKVELSKKLQEKFTQANLAVFVDYKGLSATKADDLRRKLRSHKTEVKVLKNNIARVAVKSGKFGDDVRQVIDNMAGPTLVAFSFGDPAAVAKAIHQFVKENEEIRLKDSLMGDKKLAPNQIEELASLPSREVLLAKLLGSMNSPISGFVSVLAALPRSLVTVLSAIERKKSESGAATAS